LSVLLPTKEEEEEENNKTSSSSSGVENCTWHLISQGMRGKEGRKEGRKEENLLDAVNTPDLIVTALTRSDF
jgi:hypothetical protein